MCLCVRVCTCVYVSVCAFDAKDILTALSSTVFRSSYSVYFASFVLIFFLFTLLDPLTYQHLLSDFQFLFVHFHHHSDHCTLHSLAH